jgi:Family of unknown function (DUF6186)
MATDDEAVRGVVYRGTSTHRSSHDGPEGSAARDGPSKMSLEVTGMRAIAVLGWLGIVGAFLVWQGIGLVRGPEWPTMSDFFRSFMDVPLGRFLVFGLWLWLGWHLFVRGWDLFLRS